MKLIILTVLLFLGSKDVTPQTTRTDLPRFLGRQVTIREPEIEDDFFPKGPASICVEAPPQRQCYTAPQTFGRSPSVSVVQLTKGVAALFFLADSGGVSGWAIHFALLRPGTGKELEDLFPSEISVTNQSQHAFWNDAEISDAPIFVTADYIWGPDDYHYGEHRYIVSTYRWRHSALLDDFRYYLEDRYMTLRAYDLDENADILGSEKPEILARLKRPRASTESRPAR